MQYLGDMFVKLFKILTVSKYKVKFEWILDTWVKAFLTL